MVHGIRLELFLWQSLVVNVGDSGSLIGSELVIETKFPISADLEKIHQRSFLAPLMES